jgi:hypothetical protein
MHADEAEMMMLEVRHTRAIERCAHGAFTQYNVCPPRVCLERVANHSNCAAIDAQEGDALIQVGPEKPTFEAKHPHPGSQKRTAGAPHKRSKKQSRSQHLRTLINLGESLRSRVKTEFQEVRGAFVCLVCR